MRVRPRRRHPHVALAPVPPNHRCAAPPPAGNAAPHARPVAAQKNRHQQRREERAESEDPIKRIAHPPSPGARSSGRTRRRPTPTPGLIPPEPSAISPSPTQNPVRLVANSAGQKCPAPRIKLSRRSWGLCPQTAPRASRRAAKKIDADHNGELGDETQGHSRPRAAVPHERFAGSGRDFRVKKTRGPSASWVSRRPFCVAQERSKMFCVSLEHAEAEPRPPLAAPKRT